MSSAEWPVLETERLILRGWREEDLEPLAAMNADPRVMEFFPAPLTREQSEAMLELLHEKFRNNGITFLAMELKATGEFVGFTGLNVPGYPLPFAPCVEIGWRLAHAHWGKGLAQEAARASLSYGFTAHGLQEIVAFTAVVNVRSRNVMERLKMVRDEANDFNHPHVPDGHFLQRHVLYRLSRARYLELGL